MKKIAFFIFICLFVWLPLTLNSQPPQPRRQVPIRMLSAREVFGMVFMPGYQLLTLSDFPEGQPSPHVVALWDPYNGALLKTFDLPRSAESKFGFSVFSADGQFLAATTETDKLIRLWNMFTGEHIKDITEGGKSFFGPVFSPDGRMIAAKITDDSAKTSIGLWESRTGYYIRTLDSSQHGYRSLTVFSPEGEYLAILPERLAEPPEIEVWNISTGRWLRTFRPSLNGFDRISIKDLVFNPDFPGWQGRFAVVVQRSNRYKVRDPAEIPANAQVTTIELWDLNGKLRHRLKLPIGQHIADIVFSPDGRMIAAPLPDNTVQLWDTDTGEPIRTLSSPGVHVGSVAFSPDGQRLVGTGSYVMNQDQVPLWNPHTGKLIALLAPSQAPTDQVISNIIFSPNGSFAAGTLGLRRQPILWGVSPGSNLTQ